MTRLLKFALAACLFHAATLPAMAADDLDRLPMNGIAAFEQLRLEYFIGSILTPSPSANADTLQAQAGPVRMSMRITAERWPAMRFAQQWNQLILINNDSRVLNENLMDVLAFTSFLKEDLVAGDHLTIDLTDADTTLVSLNGAPMMATTSPALFRMLLRSWIGPRPPSSEFKRDMLTMPTEAAGSALIARYEAVQPDDKRIAQARGWAMAEPAAAAETPAPAAEPDRSVAAAAARATAALVEMSPPDSNASRARPEVVAPALPAPEPAVAAAAKRAAEAPAAAAAPSAAPQPQAAPVPAPVAESAPAAVQVAAARLDEITPTTRPLDPALQLKVALDSYNNRMRGLVYRQITYPQKAIARNIEGLVVVRARLAQDGTLLSAEIAQSADRLLDKAALRAMERAAPFPVIEQLPQGAEHTFVVPMIFKLDE